MKKIVIKIFLLSSLLFVNIYSQGTPFTFNVDHSKSLKKALSDDTPAGNSVQEVIVVGDTIITISKGLNISTDNGVTWNNFYGKDPFGDDGVYAIAYNNGVVWASTGIRYFDDVVQSKLDKGTGLKYSTDMGVNWNSVPQPIDQQSDSIIVYGINSLKALPVTVPQNNVAFDIAITDGAVWIASFAAGVRKSTDNGLTWKRIVLPPDYLDHIAPTDTLSFCVSPVPGKICSEGNLNMEGFSIAAISDSIIYVGTAGGINKSTDGGISWTKFNHTNQQNPIAGNWNTYLDYNKNTGTLWASSWKAEGSTEIFAVSSTTDGGSNWSVFLPNEKCYNFGFKGNDVIATSDDGAFRSKNAGVSWILPTSIIDEESKSSLQTNTFYDAGANGNTIWLGSDAGLVRLNETGGIWQGTWKIYTASKPLSSINESYAYPNPFRPTRGTITIKYSTDGKNVPVAIRIFDFGMNYVRTIIQNVTKGLSSVSTSSIPSESAFWDGKNERGNFVPNGVYFYRIDRGSEEPLFGKIIVIQ